MVLSFVHVHGFPYFDIQIPLNCTLDYPMFISVYQIFRGNNQSMIIAQNSNVQNSTARQGYEASDYQYSRHRTFHLAHLTCTVIA